MKAMTALVRNERGNIRVVRDDYFSNQKDFSSELRANGFKVLKVWSSDVSDEVAYNWEIMNRK